jgi:hypothetical protein
MSENMPPAGWYQDPSGLGDASGNESPGHRPCGNQPSVQRRLRGLDRAVVPPSVDRNRTGRDVTLIR